MKKEINKLFNNRYNFETIERIGRFTTYGFKNIIITELNEIGPEIIGFSIDGLDFGYSYDHEEYFTDDHGYTTLSKKGIHFIEANIEK